jgi:hypothetical protein
MGVTIDHFDDSTRGASPPNLKMIPGVYRYCDYWCERCRFQQRCRVFRTHQRFDAAIASGKSIEEAIQIQCDANDEEPPPMKASERLERESFVRMLNEAISRQPTPDELQAVEEWERRRDQAWERHPLSVASGEYADLSRALLDALRALVVARGDPIVAAAIETIGRFAFTIVVKTRRAIVGAVSLDDDDDEAVARNDCNGSAKLVRLLIAESLEAWRVLLHAGCGDGVPVRMIERLESLDAGVARAFPDAMAFVRPGLDEDY